MTLATKPAILTKPVIPAKAGIFKGYEISGQAGNDRAGVSFPWKRESQKVSRFRNKFGMTVWACYCHKKPVIPANAGISFGCGMTMWVLYCRIVPESAAEKPCFFCLQFTVYVSDKKYPL